MALIKFSAPPTLAGLFFCLASVEGAGLFFLPRCNAAPYKRLQRPFCHSCKFIPPKLQNRLQGFTGAFLLIRPIPAYAIQQLHKPPMHRLRHAGGHTVKRNTSTNTQTQPPRRTLCKSTQPSYYNKVYIRVQRCAPAMDPCQTAHLLRGQRLHPAGQSNGRGRGGRRGTIDGYRRISFRAFAR